MYKALEFGHHCVSADGPTSNGAGPSAGTIMITMVQVYFTTFLLL